jgi:RHS repeat-associated protein
MFLYFPVTNLYFYHSDHLGSSSFITDANGISTQHLQYLPYGELFLEQRSTANYFTPYKFSAKEKDEETSYSYFGARYLASDFSFWLSVDPMADKYPNISPYAYCAWNPIVLVDPDGRSFTNFVDENGNLISHVEDGSNAVFKLTGSNHTNQSFQFAGFSDQKGTNNINVQGVIAGAQDYVNNNYTQCNQAVNFVGKSYESAIKATGASAPGIENVTGNKCADPIGKGLKASSGVKEMGMNSITEAKSSAHAGDLVVGYIEGHVTTMTTNDFNITRYDKKGNSSVFKYKGGMIVNVNGGERPRSEYKGLGPYAGELDKTRFEGRKGEVKC